MENSSQNNSQEQLETFDRYIKNQMGVEEKLAFEEKLAADAVLKNVFQEYNDMIFTLEGTILKEKMNRFHLNVDANKNKIKFLEKPKKVNYFVAASVVILIGFGSIWFFNLKNEGQSLFNNYFVPDPGFPTVMSKTHNYEFYSAMVEYKLGNYNKAITQWEKLLVKNSKNDTLHYFLGSAYLANKNPKKSIPFLQSVINDKNTYFKDDAYYYLGMAYLQIENMVEAKRYLKNSNSAKAKEVLTKIDK